MSSQVSFIVTLDFLKEQFANYGNVIEISLKKTYLDPVRQYSQLSSANFTTHSYVHLFLSVEHGYSEWLWFCSFPS
jgi:hypothetical protein